MADLYKPTQPLPETQMLSDLDIGQNGEIIKQDESVWARLIPINPAFRPVGKKHDSSKYFFLFFQPTHSLCDPQNH